MPLYTHKFAASPQETLAVPAEVPEQVCHTFPAYVNSPEAALSVLFTAEAKLCPNSNVGGLFQSTDWTYWHCNILYPIPKG